MWLGHEGIFVDSHSCLPKGSTPRMGHSALAKELLRFPYLDDDGGVNVSGSNFDLVRRAGGDVDDVSFAENARLSVLNTGSGDFAVGVRLGIENSASGDEGCASLS